MQAEYTLDVEDHVAFARFHAHHSPAFRRTSRSLQLGLPVVLTLIGWWTFLEPSEPFLLAVWMFLMVGILFFFPTVLRHMHIDSLRKMIREGKTETPLGRYQLVLEEDGLHYVTEASEGYLRWATMGEVVKTGGYAYIYCNASSAIVIPEDTFKSKVAFDDFVAQATQYQQRSAEEVHGHPRET